MQLNDAFEVQASPAPLPGVNVEQKAPTCCDTEMQVLLRRAVLHSDGQVEFQIAWSCGRCGRRIL
jgi:hypothetical protein